MMPEPYDFRQPSLLKPDVRDRLTAWFQTACSMAPKRWAGRLPFSLGLELQAVDARWAAGTISALGDDTFGSRVALGEAGAGTSLLIFPRPLILALVAGMLGDVLGPLPEDRELTAVETSLWEHFLRTQLLGLLQETWEGAGPLRLGLGERESLPRWTRIFGGSDELIVCRFLFESDCGRHEWQWLLPRHKVAVHVVGREERPAQALPEAERLARLQTLIGSVPVKLTVALGSAELPLAQLSSLRVGDVLILGQPVHRPLAVKVAGKTMFQGWPGRVGARQALLVDSLKE